jgi:RecB family endonuclease NucS
VDKAVKAFMELAPEAREGFSEQQYKEIQIQEKILEDYLESNITVLEDTLTLAKDGRQYETVVGPIDLLAIEKSGGFVVVELKKGRAADKVFGQLCRYMGYIKREVANGAPVRGIIVGKEIDQKLEYAVEAVPEGLVSLKAFDLKLAMQDRGLAKRISGKTA